jgi:hemolysin activation/secretion protein
MGYCFARGLFDRMKVLRNIKFLIGIQGKLKVWVVLVGIACPLILTETTYAQTIIPPPPSFPTPEPTPLEPSKPPLQVPPSPTQPIPENLSKRLTVTAFEFTGNTVFSNQELGNILATVEGNQVSIASIQNQTLTFSQMLQIASQVVDFYHQQGYKTSGALISLPNETREQGQGIVKIRVVEGTLEEINVGLLNSDRSGRLRKYVRSRLGVDEDEPLNVDDLLEALQLLQIDPLINSISAKLAPGTEQGKSILEVRYQPADSFSLGLAFDNSRPPSVGSEQRSIFIREGNVLGLGDSLRLDYANTDGSHVWGVSYEVPVNPRNGSLRFEYIGNVNYVIESPFYDIDQDGKGADINSDYGLYDLTFRQPILRSINNQTYQEVALSLGLSHTKNQSLLFDEFPLSISADSQGRTRTTALRFSQDYTRQTPIDVVAIRSQFSFGLGLFDATMRGSEPEIGDIPDSNFFDWRLQGQYVRVLAPDTLFVVQSYLQLANSPLLPSEQFYLGGFGSVRGYRQDQILSDNGYFISTEVRLPILRVPSWDAVLQVTPFVDYGIAWNGVNPDPNNLASVGLGLLWRQGDFSARLDWGIPLIDVNGRYRTWQENGLYFRIQYTPF